MHLEVVSPSDNFFDLGGDSLLAGQLVVRMEQVLDIRFPVANFFKAPTFEAMVHLVQEDTIAAYTSSDILVPIQPKGSKPPLFCLHMKGGNVFSYYAFAKYFPQDQPIYGVQARGLDEGKVYCDRIETMARDYIQEIQSFQPEGPYLLCGYSFGGLLAY